MKFDPKKYPQTFRVRHHVSPNLYLPASDIKILPKNYPPLIESLNWKEYFSNGMGPDMLDIGCGKGAFLLDLCEKFPDKNTLGIEIRRPLVLWINEIIIGENIKNCSALWYSIVNGLDFIKESSVEKVFYLFPDPWFKNKQKKRRAYSEKFLADISKVIRSGGNLYLATDVPDVHLHHKKLLNRSDIWTYKEVDKDDEWELPVTNKELFCRRKNIPFQRLICKLKEGK